MKVSREQVLKALAEYKKLGKAAFLKKYGFADATRYLLVFRNFNCPSKAILGVAMGKAASEFSGGVSGAVRVLKKLGFKIIEKVAEKITRFIKIATMAIIPFAASPMFANAPVEPAIVFPSGCGSPGEAEGFSHAGYDVGIAADHCSPEFEAYLSDALPGTDVQLFTDSGAFSEVEYNKETGKFEVVKPITHEMWKNRLGLYKRLTSSLKDQAHVVAPDRVGDQDITLERLSRYSEELVELWYSGARVLIPLQRGRLKQADFFVEACKACGLQPDEVTPALPCKKAGTSEDELVEFLKAIHPGKLHLLGLGIRGKLAKPFLTKVAEHSPETLVQVDSNVMRAHVGRAKMGKFTYCQDYASYFTDNTADKKSLAIIMGFGDYATFAPIRGAKITGVTPPAGDQLVA